MVVFLSFSFKNEVWVQALSRESLSGSKLSHSAFLDPFIFFRSWDSPIDVQLNGFFDDTASFAHAHMLVTM